MRSKVRSEADLRGKDKVGLKQYTYKIMHMFEEARGTQEGLAF